MSITVILDMNSPGTYRRLLNVTLTQTDSKVELELLCCLTYSAKFMILKMAAYFSVGSVFSEEFTSKSFLHLY